jgi:hypothetical protein
VSRYRKVLSKIWSDEKFRSLSEDGQRLFLYHLTSDRATPFLLYVEGPGAISDALCMPSARLSRAMKEVSAKDMVWYGDDGCNLVFLPKALLIPENAPESPNAVKTWLNLLSDLPKTPFYYKCLRHWLCLREGITHTLALAFLKALLMASPIQEQEQEQEFPPQSPPGDGGGEKEKGTKGSNGDGKTLHCRYVLLEPGQYADLCAKFGKAKADDYIAALDARIGTNTAWYHKKYKSDYDVIIVWQRNGWLEPGKNVVLQPKGQAKEKWQKALDGEI